MPRVLVVDDDSKLRAEVQGVLNRRGYESDGADSAVQALSLLKDKTYDVILVDYRMPDHNGAWFMSQARLPRHTKALLVTSFVDRTAMESMFSAGVCGYIIKPFDEEDLLRNLEFHMTRHSPSAASSS